MAVTSVSFGAFQTNDGILADQHAAPLVRARTQPAIVRGPLQRVSVIPFGAPVAVFARRVVLTNAPTCGSTRTNVIHPFVVKRTTTKGGSTHPRSQNQLFLPVSASQIEAWPWQLHGTHGENGPPLVGSCREPGAQDSQNCPMYPSGHVHISTQSAGKPGAPRRAVCSEKSSKKPTPKKPGKNKTARERFYYYSPTVIW